MFDPNLGQTIQIVCSSRERTRRFSMQTRGGNLRVALHIYLTSNKTVIVRASHFIIK